MNRLTTAAFLRGALLGTSMLLPATALAAPNPQYWNGATTTGDGVVHGGTGTWNTTSTNWTDSTGVNSDAWSSLGAIFQGTPGTVTTGAGVITTGMTFVGTGWTLAGTAANAITLGSPTTIINVGTGTQTVSGVLAGANKMELSGTGTLIFTGTNSYSGGTQIDAGSTLQVGATGGGTTGTISNTGAMLNNGTLVLSRSNAYTYSGVITGTGSIKQLGAGTVTLSGNSSAFAGTVTVGDGITGRTLTISGGMGGVVTVTNLSTLNGNAGTATPIASVVVQSGGTLAGTGFVTAANIQSGGTLNMTTGTVTNATVASGAKVIGGGSIVNSAFASGSTIQGTVQFTGANTIGSGVILSPGLNGVGTAGAVRVSATGSLTLASGSIYQVDLLNGGTNDAITSLNTVTVQNGAKLQINEIGSSWTNETVYKIITATNGVGHPTTGGFVFDTSNTSLNSLAFLTPTITYNPNDVSLTLTRNDVVFSALGITQNQMNVGAAIQSIGLSSNPMYHSILVGTVGTVRDAFNQLSGELHASVRGVIVDDSRLTRNAIFNRLSENSDRGVWVSGFDNWGTTDIDDEAAATRHDTKGFLAGADMHVTDMVRVGAAAGWSHTDLNIDDRNSNAIVNTAHILAYANAAYQAFSLDIGAGYAHSNLDTTRIVAYTGYSDLLKGNYDSSTLQAFGEASYRMPMRSFDILPFANVAVVNGHTSGFSETGGVAALSSDDKSETSAFATFGARVQAAVVGDFSVNASAGYRRTFGTATPYSTLSFAGSDAFTVEGMATDRDALATDIGANWYVTPSLIVSASYDGLLSMNSHDDAVRISLKQDL